MRSALIRRATGIFGGLVLLSLLFFQAGVAAGATIYALVILPEAGSEPLILTGLKINGKDAVLTFGDRPAPPTLLKRDYATMQKISLADFKRILFTDGILTGETASGDRHVILPQNIKAWPKNAATAARLPELLGHVLLAGKFPRVKRKHNGRLRPGTVIYFYPAEPRPDEIAFAHTELDGTRAAYQRFLEAHPQSPHVVDARGVLSGELGIEALAALDEYEKALRDRSAGYTNLDKARERIRRLETLGPGDPKLARAKTRLKKYEDEIKRIRAEARTALEANQFTKAVTALEPIEHFQTEFPALHEEITAIRQAAFRYFMIRGDHFSLEAKFTEARTAADRAEKWGSSAELAELRENITAREKEHERRRAFGRTVATANNAVRSGDYLTALKLLNDAVKANPADAGLRDQRDFARQKLRGQLITRAPEIERTHTPIKQGNLAGEKTVLELSMGMTVLAEADTTDAEAIYWRDTIRDYLAEYYLGRARALVPTKNIAPSPLAYAFLQQAYYLTPVSGRPAIREMASWRPQVEGDLSLRLMLKVQDSTPELVARSAARQLRGLLANKLQQSGMPNLKVFAENARPNGDVLELRIDITRASAQDSKQSETIASEYIAGSRQSLNPEWERAKLAYDAAVIDYEKLRTAGSKKMNKRKRQEHDAAIAIALGQMNESRKVLDGTQTYIQDDDIRPYSIARNTVTRTVVVEIAYRWIRDGIILETRTAIHEESAEGAEIVGANPADRNGHRDQSASLPSVSDLIGRAVTAMHVPMAAEFALDIAAQISDNYEQGRRLASRSNSIQAAEHFIRYLYNSPKSDPRRKEAVAYLEKEFNLLTLDTWLHLDEASADN